MEIDMQAAYVICKFSNGHISKIWGGSLWVENQALLLSLGILWDGRESSNLLERALPLSSGDAAGGGYSRLGAENLRRLPGCPGWGLSGSAVHVSRSPAPLVGVEVYEN